MEGNVMKMIEIGPQKLKMPALIQGLMRITHMTAGEVVELIEKDLELGITFLDNADIYGADHFCEKLLGEAFAKSPGLRDKVTLQTKCGIVNGSLTKYYDYSEKHILEACDASLKRLNTDHIDIYLLHRPDALYEPEEIASAFDKLEQSGKVLNFGVSNMNTAQLTYLRKFVKQPITVNQLHFTLTHTGMVDSALCTNRAEYGAFDHDGGILDYCRFNDCTIQAWSPFRAVKSKWTGEFIPLKVESRPFIGSDEFPAVNAKLNEVGKRYGISPGATVIAWILRHPAKMQIVLGSTKTARIEDACEGAKVEITREEWYELYSAAGNVIP